MTKALINNNILKWAMLRAGVSEDELGDRMSVRVDKVLGWVMGDSHPTFAQAQKMAKILGIPFGYFYLNEPPAEVLPVADFRTVSSGKISLDVNTKNFLQDTFYKLDWYKDYLDAQGHTKLDFVGSMSLKDSPEAVANSIRERLRLHPRPKVANHEDYLKYLVAEAEAIGIWVMRTSMVGNNTHRLLSTEVFRGIAISDQLAPLIVINSSDAKSAQIFTLIHEIAHIWIGQSGISNVDLVAAATARDSETEAFCNKVAAEVLTPVTEFKLKWRAGVQLEDQADVLADYFKVSRIVIARRALGLNFITREIYQKYSALEAARWAALAKKQKLNSTGSPPQHVMMPVRYGRNFTKSVLAEAVRGSMLLKEASTLLGMKPGRVFDVYKKIQAQSVPAG